MQASLVICASEHQALLLHLFPFVRCPRPLPVARRYSLPFTFPSPLTYELPLTQQNGDFTEVMIQPRTLRTLYGVPDGERGGWAGQGNNRLGIAAFDDSYLHVSQENTRKVVNFESN